MVLLLRSVRGTLRRSIKTQRAPPSFKRRKISAKSEAGSGTAYLLHPLQGALMVPVALGRREAQIRAEERQINAVLVLFAVRVRGKSSVHTGALFGRQVGSRFTGRIGFHADHSTALNTQKRL